MDRKEKLEELKDNIDTIGDKVKDTAETIQIKGMYKKDDIDAKLKDAKGSLEAAKQNTKRVHERGKSKLSSEMLKLQMNFEETKKNLADKKEEKNKEKLEKYIDDKIEYSEDCIAAAILAAKEAKVAFLEALDAELDYEEKYGDDEEDKEEK